MNSWQSAQILELDYKYLDEIDMEPVGFPGQESMTESEVQQLKDALYKALLAIEIPQAIARYNKRLDRWED